jgi:hypothetical protein
MGIPEQHLLASSPLAAMFVLVLRLEFWCSFKDGTLCFVYLEAQAYVSHMFRRHVVKRTLERVRWTWDCFVSIHSPLSVALHLHMDLF